MEQWLEIQEFPEYQISNEGRVWSNITNRILKPGVAGKGYLFVTLYKNRIPYQKYVHRLVALAFLGVSDQEINHIDGDKQNNTLDNLEWVRHRRNMRHAHDSIWMVSPGRPTQSVQIVETGEIYASISSCARAINGYESGIRSVLKGRRRHHLGYTFKYVE